MAFVKFQKGKIQTPQNCGVCGSTQDLVPSVRGLVCKDENACLTRAVNKNVSQ